MTAEEFMNEYTNPKNTNYYPAAIAEALCKLCCDGKDEALIAQISVPLSEILSEGLSEESADDKRALYTVLADITYRLNNYMI